jgi:DNA polymerase I-like protein with 3'-5' exonuclease and polymerase domains
MKKLEVNTRLRSILEPSGTGRWYPHGDALFTIPKHEPEAGLLRRHLIPEVGHVFVSGDYAAFEPRLLAHQSSDPELIKACNAPDLYDHLKPLLRVPDRDTAKQALLAFMYGRSPALFAESLPLPLPDGHRIYAAIEAALPVAMAYRERVHATETISARTMGGWRRVRGTESRAKFARMAFNLKMQGSAGDLLRKLLRDLNGSLPPGASVVHQEFDAVVVTCPVDMAVTIEPLLKLTMENVASLSVPLRVKTKHGATLADVS